MCSVAVVSCHTLANGVGLASLALQRVLLASEVLVHVLMTASRGAVLGNLFLVLLDLLFIHLAQSLHGELDVGDQSIASAAREVLTNNNTHHLEALRVRSHGVSRDDPATLSELVCNSELVKQVAVVGVKTESDQRKTFTTSLRHELETHLLYRGGQIVCSSGEVEHNGTVAVLAQTN